MAFNPSSADVLLAKEEEFNNAIRDSLIVLLTFISLYIVSYCVISYFQLKREREGWYSNEDDAKVYRISLNLCTVTLVVSLSNILLLPMSTIANEVLHLFPNSYWVQWLNGDLVNKMWWWVYFSSNISIFALLPFSYFLIESEGFTGNKNGILPRIYETIVVLLLFAVLVFGIVALALAFFDGDNTGLDFVLFVGEYYVQHIYSFLLCCSAFVILTFCAPRGMTMLFDIASDRLVKPRIFGTSESSINILNIQQESLIRKRKLNKRIDRALSLDDEIKEIQINKDKLLREQRASGWERNIGYPVVMLLIILATGLSLFLVVLNILELLFYGSINHDPTQNKKLGVASLSMIGLLGSFLEVYVQFYIVTATLLGFYNLPLLRKIKPVKHGTPMTTVIWNCVFLQILTSAMPVLSTVLGITDFSLRGSYRSFYWLHQFYIVIVYNIIFAVVAALCLGIKVTGKVRTELYNALGLDSKTGPKAPESPPSQKPTSLFDSHDELSSIATSPNVSLNEKSLNVISMATVSHDVIRCTEADSEKQKSI